MWLKDKAGITEAEIENFKKIEARHRELKE
jgi:hypothetical protein